MDEKSQRDDLFGSTISDPGGVNRVPTVYGRASTKIAGAVESTG